MTYSLPVSRCAFYLLAILGLFQTSCKDEVPEAVEIRFTDDLYANTNSLEVLIGYEEGAEPYISYNGKESWDVADFNLNMLLNTKNIRVKIPKKLGEMTNLGVLEQNNYTRQNIIDLAAEVQRYANKDTAKGIVLLFLNGYYIRNGAIEKQILGVNIDGSAIVAIFKPVVKSATTDEAKLHMIEQTTAIHEIGHVVGLVNNGVRATTAHHDVGNGTHCTNTDCVMYWKNGAGEVSQYMADFLSGKEIKLFGDQCIADVSNK